MTDERPFPENPETTREAIMKATYHALCEHGYADLTIKRIGDHFEKSKSLLYHHYDSKDELLLEFLTYMLEEFRESVPEVADDGAKAHLDAIFDRIFPAELPERRREFRKAMTELRAQAAHDERYREYFTEHDEFFQRRFAEIIAAGIEEGVFADVDPDRAAAFLRTVIAGEMNQRVTADADVTGSVRDELDRYVETVLSTPEGEE